MAGVELPLQMQLLLPSELSNSLRGSFAMTAAYLPGMLTCFHGIELPLLEGPRGSVLANSLTGCSLSSSTPSPLPWLCPKAWSCCSCSPLAMGQLCLDLRVFADHSQWKPFLTPLSPLDLCLYVSLLLLESRFQYL